MIPRRFFWIFDLLVELAAFLTAYAAVANLSNILDPTEGLGGPLRSLEPLRNWRGELPPINELAWIFLVVAPVTLVVLGVLGNHEPVFSQSRSRIIVGGILAPLSGLGLISLAVFALKNPNWSRLFLFSFSSLSAFGLVSYRLGFRFYSDRRRALGHYAKNVVLVGPTSSIEWMIGYFKQEVSAAEYRLLGYLLLEPDASPADSDLRVVGCVEHLGTLLINEPIHEVIAVQPLNSGEWLRQVIRDCDYFGVVLRIVPEALLVEQQRFLKVLYPFSPLNLPALVLTSPHWNSEALYFKRMFDVVISTMMLVILSPVFLVIAIAIKLTTPAMAVFYRWRVVGRNGVEFTGYKFTTMISNAEQLRQELEDRNEMQGPVFKIKDDPRITPLGGFLRKYSLNELPQLWSVLKGDMSLVGPRPAFRHELERYEFWHKRKLSISPGITCLWQIRGRNKITDFDDWVRMDLEYIDNWSLWLDFKILIRTAWVVIAGTGS